MSEDAPAKNQLCDQTIIVTGGNKGLGREMALTLVRAGANVVVTGRNQSDLDAVESEARAITEAGSLRGIRTDIRSPQDCERVIATTVDAFGALTALVNNAGVSMRVVSEEFETDPPKFWNIDIESWRAIMDTNLSGSFFMARLAVPLMLKRGKGRIINVSSSPTVMRRPGWSPYGASKAALESLTIIWAQELFGTGITVNSVRPGGKVDTGIFPNGGHGARTQDGFLPPTVMNELIVWLLSHAADGITGKRFNASRWDKNQPPAIAARAATIPYPELPHLF